MDAASAPVDVHSADCWSSWFVTVVAVRSPDASATAAASRSAAVAGPAAAAAERSDAAAVADDEYRSTSD